jgi:type I restriction enzyme S subunit
VALAFGRFANEIMRKIRNTDEQSRTLTAISNALLPRLLSGELRVKMAEKLVENAVGV